jgi:hypothetical protein
VRRQTTAGPGGLIDKGTQGKRAFGAAHRGDSPLVQRRTAARFDPNVRMFAGPRGGRISTAVLRDATHWNEVVTKLGHEHVRRHDLRHTGLTWMADAGVPVHVLRKIAGHGSRMTTQRYLHSDSATVAAAGDSLTTTFIINRLRQPDWAEDGITANPVSTAPREGGVEGEGGRFRRNHWVPMPKVDSIAQLNDLLAAADAKANCRRIDRSAARR